MDFLRIRQKAKERAESRPPAVAPAPRGAATARLEDVLRDELADAARARESSPTTAPAPTPADPLDEFFWREDEDAPGLPEALAPAATPVAPVAPEAPEARREWLTFWLGGEEYAIAIDAVREILKMPAVTEVPRAPAHILGVIMVRGEVIAVFDPRRRLGLPVAPPGPRARIVVCDPGDGPRGLLVDAVSQVVRLPPSAIEARPSGIGGASAEYIAAIGRDEGSLFILLDLPVVLGDAAPRRVEAEP
jgi:purine-binding chemotaxis protein CheW